MKKIAFILLLLVAPTWAAITNIQRKVNSAGANAFVTVTATGAGHLITVSCTCGSAAPCTGVTDNASGGSSTYVEAVASRGFDATISGRSNIFYSLNSKSGATTITCAGTGVQDVFADEWNWGGSVGTLDISSGTVNRVGSGTTSLGPTMTSTNAGDVWFGTGFPTTGYSAIASPWGNLQSDSFGVGSYDMIPGVIETNNQPSLTTFGTADHNIFTEAAFAPGSSSSVVGTNKRIKRLRMDE